VKVCLSCCFCAHILTSASSFYCWGKRKVVNRHCKSSSN
jgi:hypothetical protein